mmetsp:Transcript_24435/g.55080  ORF Transcript_24435/g.55080 Transcript_24435/m.55080 type:complete len:235 (-) Transcript_24435:1484-2188(-)
MREASSSSASPPGWSTRSISEWTARSAPSRYPPPPLASSPSEGASLPCSRASGGYRAEVSPCTTLSAGRGFRMLKSTSPEQFPPSSTSMANSSSVAVSLAQEVQPYRTLPSSRWEEEEESIRGARWMLELQVKCFPLPATLMAVSSSAGDSAGQGRRTCSMSPGGTEVAREEEGGPLSSTLSACARARGCADWTETCLLLRWLGRCCMQEEALAWQEEQQLRTLPSSRLGRGGA